MTANETNKATAKTVKIEATTEVRVESELYVAGRDEFGTDFTAESYYVEVSFLDGSTLRHERSFDGTKATVTPDGFNCFPDLREEAKAAAEHLASRVRAGGAINPAHWSEGRAIYGTPAYLDEVALLTPEQRAQ